MSTARDKKNDKHAHSVMAAGYIQEQKVFIVRNSWGTCFGQHGYFYMPFAYLKYCYVFWTIRVVYSPKH